MPLLRVEGEVDSPRHFDFHDLAALPGQVVEVGTLLPGREGRAVQLRALLDPVGIKQTATHITLSATNDSCAASVPLAAVADRGILVDRLGSTPLPLAKGGPVRFYTVGVEECARGEVDACANVKYLTAIRLTIGPGEDTRRVVASD
jgi:DMSO/TMAO reductase YedYZ molybdopterin-dependent catalytic subunit